MKEFRLHILPFCCTIVPYLYTKYDTLTPTQLGKRTIDIFSRNFKLQQAFQLISSWVCHKLTPGGNLSDSLSHLASGMWNSVLWQSYRPYHQHAHMFFHLEITQHGIWTTLNMSTDPIHCVEFAHGCDKSLVFCTYSAEFHHIETCKRKCLESALAIVELPRVISVSCVC